MTDSEAVEVRPLKNGKWRVSGVADSLDDLAAAAAAARGESGSVEAFDKDGNSLGFTAPTRPVLLLREDGSTYGELGAGSPGSGGDAQRLDLAAATIDNRAEAVE